jgi:glycosyltransferase involved in cell wall biosynthesis
MRVLNYLINSVPMMLQIKRLVKNINPDIIHAHYIMETTLLGAASGFHPFVVTPWGSDVLIATRKSRMSGWVTKYVLKKADLITCDAEHIKEPLTKLGAEPQKIKLIYFGTDTRKFNPGQGDEKLREELGILASPTIISLRRFEPVYDVESLITAVPLVLREVPKAKFLLVEKGSQEAELKKLAKSLGVSDSVKFVGWVPEDELPRYLALADIYVSTSLSDAGLASSTAEAMACGLPVIITNFGDNKKWVEDGVNGFIIPLKAPQVLAAKIIYLLKDKETRKRFGKINRGIIVERNNREKEMEKVAKLYEELIEKHKKVPVA